MPEPPTIEGVADAASALVPWLSERLKDAQILKQEIVVVLVQIIDEREVPVFSDRYDAGKDALSAFVDGLLDSAIESCYQRPGRNRFMVRIKGDSRQKSFVLHAPNVGAEGRLASSPVTSEDIEDRRAWIAFGAAAVSNTAQITKISEETRSKKPGTSRSFNTIAPDEVSKYATRVADEMLRAYRARWPR